MPHGYVLDVLSPDDIHFGLYVGAKLKFRQSETVYYAYTSLFAAKEVAEQVRVEAGSYPVIYQVVSADEINFEAPAELGKHKFALGAWVRKGEGFLSIKYDWQVSDFLAVFQSSNASPRDIFLLLHKLYARTIKKISTGSVNDWRNLRCWLFDYSEVSNDCFDSDKQFYQYLLSILRYFESDTVVHIIRQFLQFMRHRTRRVKLPVTYREIVIDKKLLIHTVSSNRFNFYASSCKNKDVYKQAVSKASKAIAKGRVLKQDILNIEKTRAPEENSILAIPLRSINFWGSGRVNVPMSSVAFESIDSPSREMILRDQFDMQIGYVVVLASLNQKNKYDFHGVLHGEHIECSEFFSAYHQAEDFSASLELRNQAGLIVSLAFFGSEFEGVMSKNTILVSSSFYHSQRVYDESYFSDSLQYLDRFYGNDTIEEVLQSLFKILPELKSKKFAIHLNACRRMEKRCWNLHEALRFLNNLRKYIDSSQCHLSSKQVYISFIEKTMVRLQDLHLLLFEVEGGLVRYHVQVFYQASLRLVQRREGFEYCLKGIELDIELFGSSPRFLVDSFKERARKMIHAAVNRLEELPLPSIQAGDALKDHSIVVGFDESGVLGANEPEASESFSLSSLSYSDDEIPLLEKSSKICAYKQG